MYLLFVSLMVSNCKSTQNVKDIVVQKSFDYCFTCNLQNNEDAISKYKQYHSAEGIWPEVTKAAEDSGMLKLRIYIQASRLVMIISLPESLSFDEFNRRYAESSPKLKEWADIMGTFQIAPPGAEEGQTWVKMENIYDYQKEVDIF